MTACSEEGADIEAEGPAVVAAPSVDGSELFARLAGEDGWRVFGRASHRRVPPVP